ncbi:MAG: GNAT family N-acetyltransferase [Solirubrobacterales bacterium]|nr:GNAT family N-acetyltransferase [Solirubrobacterales bacterium]
MLRTLYYRTEIGVLGLDARVRRADQYVVVESPSNPISHAGNFLLADAAPALGDRARWEGAFDAELPPAVKRRSFGWDTGDGSLGEAATEFPAPDYELEQLVTLAASPAKIAPPRDPSIPVRMLDPDADAELWTGVQELWEEDNDSEEPAAYREFAKRRLEELRELFRAGRGGWFVALDGERVVGSLGVVVADELARYQNVSTRASHRRRGIASTLVSAAAAQIAARHPIQQLVIVADPDYHAIGLYERLGFQRRERVCLARGGADFR